MIVNPPLLPFTGRQEQMFPVLSPREVERVRRFASTVRYADGEQIASAGRPGPGLLLVLDAH